MGNGALYMVEEEKKTITNCVYCPEYNPIHSPQCQGYMCYCNFLKRKINVYEDFKKCDKNDPYRYSADEAFNWDEEDED